MPEIITPEVIYQTVRRINCEFSNLEPEFTLKNRTKKFNLPDRGVKKTTFKKIIELAKKRNLLSEEGRIELINRKENLTFKCDKCNLGININKYKGMEFIEKIIHILKKRPEPVSELDHQPLIPYFTIIRAAAIYESESLYQKRIIFIGDFDSTALAVSILSKPKEIVVVDIDDRLIDYFKEQAILHNLPIKTIKYNLMKPLPKNLQNRFDIFVTDPPYAIKGMNTFIKRGISALKKGGSGYIAAPFHDNLPWTWEINHEIQKVIMHSGCVITDLLKNFHEYQTADGLTSSLIRIKKGIRYLKADKNSFYWWKKDKDKQNQNQPELKRSLI